MIGICGNHHPIVSLLASDERVRNSTPVPCRDAEFGKLKAPADVGVVVRAVKELQQVFTKATLDIRNNQGIYKAIEMARLIPKVPGITGAEIDDLSRASMIVQTLRRAEVQ